MVETHTDHEGHQGQSETSNSGFHIAYEVRECEYGKGLFAKSNVPVGAIVWEYKKDVNIKEYNEAEYLEKLSTLTLEDAKYNIISSYCQRGLVCEILDDAHYINHSLEPNCITQPNLITYAKREIQAGE